MDIFEFLGVFMNAICCDVDGTLTDFEGFVLKYGRIFLERKYGLKNISINYEGYDLDEVFLKGRLEDYFLLNYSISIEDILAYFWNVYYIFYVSQKLKPGSSTFFKNLCENEKLLITTSRKKSTSQSLLGLFVRKTIFAQLKIGKIPFDKIYFFENDDDKVEFIKSIKPVLVFDDKPNIISRLSADGEKVVCVDSSYNRGQDLNALRIKQYNESSLLAVKKLRRK